MLLINNPLGFYILSVLIISALVGKVLASKLPKKFQFYSILICIGIFLFLVIIVTFIVWNKPYHLG